MNDNDAFDDKLHTAIDVFAPSALVVFVLSGILALLAGCSATVNVQNNVLIDITADVDVNGDRIVSRRELIDGYAELREKNDFQRSIIDELQLRLGELREMYSTCMTLLDADDAWDQPPVTSVTDVRYIGENTRVVGSCFFRLDHVVELYTGDSSLWEGTLVCKDEPHPLNIAMEGTIGDGYDTTTIPLPYGDGRDIYTVAIDDVRTTDGKFAIEFAYVHERSK